MRKRELLHAIYEEEEAFHHWYLHSQYFHVLSRKSENGSLGRKSNGKGVSRKDRAPEKVSQSQIERLLSRNSPTIPMPS